MGDVRNSITGTVHGDAAQAGRDIHSIKISGGSVDVLDALAAVSRLRTALSAVELAPGQREMAERELGDVERELSSATPDKRVVAHRLERLTALLKAAGGVATAGAALVGPIGVIANWLGPVGAELLRAFR